MESKQELRSGEEGGERKKAEEGRVGAEKEAGRSSWRVERESVEANSTSTAMGWRAGGRQKLWRAIKNKFGETQPAAGEYRSGGGAVFRSAQWLAPPHKYCSKAKGTRARRMLNIMTIDAVENSSGYSPSTYLLCLTTSTQHGRISRGVASHALPAF